MDYVVSKAFCGDYPAAEVSDESCKQSSLASLGSAVFARNRLPLYPRFFLAP